MSRLAECRHEADLVAAVTNGRWPAAVDVALREHVTSCAVCADVLQVAEAMAGSSRKRWPTRALPAAGQVWWRAQVRARHDAAVVAARPVMVAQALGGAAALGLVAGVVCGKWAAIATVATLDLGLIAWVGVATAAVLGPLAINAAVRE